MMKSVSLFLACVIIIAALTGCEIRLRLPNSNTDPSETKPFEGNDSTDSTSSTFGPATLPDTTYTKPSDTAPEDPFDPNPPADFKVPSSELLSDWNNFDCISISEARAIARQNTDVPSKIWYYIVCEIFVSHPQRGIALVGSDDVLNVGRTYNCDGSVSYEMMHDKPIDGDTVLLYGCLWQPDENAEPELVKAYILDFKKASHTPLPTEPEPEPDYEEDTSGLVFELSSDRSYYIVVDRGTNEDKHLVIPSTYRGKPVKEIGWNALKEMHMVTLIIPEGVTRIADGAFMWCGELETVNFPNTLEYIGANAFYYCLSIKHIEIPDSVTEIGEAAFFQCLGLESAKLSSGMTAIPDVLFDSCSALTTVEIPNSITSIGYSAFGRDDMLTDIILPNNLKSIGDFAFYGCKSLTTINFPDTLEHIGHYSFGGTMLTEVIIPEGITCISDWTFSNCKALKTVKLPDSLTEIQEHAFYYCTQLEYIAIPKGVAFVRSEAFSCCSSLTSVDLLGTDTVVEDGAFPESTVINPTK